MNIVTKLFSSQLAKKISANTLYQLIGKFFTMLVTVGITLSINYVYKDNNAPYVLGNFTLMQSFPAFFFVIVDFGINAIATKHLSTNWKDATHYLQNILVIRVLFSTLIIILVSLVLYFLPYSADLRFGIQLGMLLLLTQSIYATLNIIFQVKLRYDLANLGLVIGYVFILLSAGYLLFISPFSNSTVNITYVNFAYVFAGIITIALNYYFIKKFQLKLRPLLDTQLCKNLFKASLPIGLMFVFSQINFKSDALLLSVLDLPSTYGLNNVETVGVYGLAYKIFEVALVLPTFIMNALFPIYVQKFNKGREEFLDIFSKSIWVLGGFGLFVALGGIIFAPLIIRILSFGNFESYASAVPLMRILMGGIFIFYITQPLSWLLVTLDKQIYLPYIYAISALFNFVTNLVFIPRYSFFASSILTWISELLILVLLIIAARYSWKQKYA